MANQCDGCLEYFESPFHLIAHRRKKCKSKTCGNCGAKFRQHRDLLRHQKNRKNITCTHCSRTFCSNEHFSQHERSIQEVPETDINLDQPIQPETGFENEEGYKAVLKTKENEIKDKEVIGSNHMVVNKEIDPSFTYSDLEKIITDIYAAQSTAFKLNLSFAFIYMTLSIMSTDIITTLETTCCLKKR